MMWHLNYIFPEWCGTWMIYFWLVWHLNDIFFWIVWHFNYIFPKWCCTWMMYSWLVWHLNDIFPEWSGTWMIFSWLGLALELYFSWKVWHLNDIFLNGVALELHFFPEWYGTWMIFSRMVWHLNNIFLCGVALEWYFPEWCGRLPSLWLAQVVADVGVLGRLHGGHRLPLLPCAREVGPAGRLGGVKPPHDFCCSNWQRR